MMLADRGMRRSEFRKILDSELTMQQININGFVGIAGILDVKVTTGE